MDPREGRRIDYQLRVFTARCDVDVFGYGDETGASPNKDDLEGDWVLALAGDG